ncbi:MAG: hypothetical protein AAGH81_10510 [Bacteroidota bacterium]
MAEFLILSAMSRLAIFNQPICEEKTMTDDNYNDDDDNTPIDKALDAVEEFDEAVSLDPHLKRAMRHLTIGIDEIKTAMRKRGILPFGKH